MSKVYETLKKKNDTSVEVYPNIERTNIPDGAINTAKLEDASVTTVKIVDNAVTFNKLNGALQDDITNFNNIYDDEDDKLSVSDIEVSDDIHCTNVYASSSVYATDSVNADNVTANTYFDGDNDELKVIVNHCISAQLVNKDDPTDVRWINMHFLSSKKDAFTTFSELLNELSKKVNMTTIDNANNVIGWIESVNLNDGYVSIYVYDGNSGIESRDYGSANTINDDVNSI